MVVDTPALAQEDERIQTVTVTANKRVEDIQRVPIAVSVLSADAASKLGVVNPQMLAQAVPGLELNRQTVGITPFLRGVGNQSSQAGAEPAVAMYVDDVYLGANSAGLTNYNTIQRIEVLKGPQGTLFGRNATGGVIQVFTKNPTPERHLDASIGYANYNAASGSIYATGAIFDALAANIALYGSKQYEGWGHNFTTGHYAYTEYNVGGRVKFLWTPTDKTSLLLTLDLDRFLNQQSVFFRPAPGTMSNAGAASIPPPNDYDSNENLDPVARVQQQGASLKATHEFGWGKLVSITAHRSAGATQYFAQDGNPTPRLNAYLYYPLRSTSQEFQLLSPDGSPLIWILGLYYWNDSSAVDPLRFTGTLAGGGDNFKASVTEQTTHSYSGFGQATATVLPNTHLTAGLRYTLDERSLTGGRVSRTGGVTGALVPAVNSGISDKWSQVSGKVSLDYQFTDLVMGYIAYNRGFKSGLFNTIIAPSFARTTAPAVPTIDPPVKPEKLDAYTVGMKSEFLDHRLRVNAEAFYYKYKNLQLQQVFLIPGGGTTTLLTNAASASMKGIDLDVTAIPINNLSVTASIEAMDGQYDDFAGGQFFVYNAATGGNCSFTVVAGGPAPCRGTALPPHYDPVSGTWNLKGNKTVQTPPFSFTLTGTYDIPTSVGAFGLTLSWFHSGNYYADPDNGRGQVAPSSQENDRQKVLNILNGSVDWNSNKGMWNVRAWIRNIGDRRYWSFANETSTVTKNTPAPPRTYGITVTTYF